VELQYHPASGRRTVAAISLGRRGERILIFLVALAALLAVSLWWTVPAGLTRAVRWRESLTVARDLEISRADMVRAGGRVAALADRELAWGDDFAKIAFLYGVTPAGWPRVLDPARGILAAPDGERLTEGLPVYLRGLERGRALLAAMEQGDPGLAARTPSIAPISGAIYEPAALFGPRVSPWTGQEEFFCGLDLAAAEGAAVVAPADGRVVFTGRARRETAPRLWQFGSLVVVVHGPEAATLFGHLLRIEVRRGERVRRGQRLGAVGRSGWALSPRLHYELWKPQEGVWRPTDPLFAILDRRLDARHRSLGQMLATSAPGPTDVLPGLR
jgi:murein DD-endopeptidase MepM/ murein hydrolase activator NlpD